MEERAFELVERQWKLVVLLVWLGFCAGLDLRANGANPLVSARRYRRQYAHDAGARAAPWPGLVRPSPVSNEPAVRCEHPLVAAGRSADCRAYPCAAAVPWRAGRRALGGRHSAASALSALAVFRGADRAAADRPARVSVRVAGDVLRRLRPTECSCRNASIIMAGSWRCWRSASAAVADPRRARGGAGARHLHRASRSRSGWR